LIKGRALDNVLTEGPWLTRKYEEVCLRYDATPKEERCGIDGYFDFYNHWRPHQSLVYQMLAEVCF
jgi:putative transposase